MSYLTLPASGRVAIRDTATNLAALSQRFAQDARTPTLEEAMPIELAIEACYAALGAAEALSDEVVIADAQTVTVPVTFVAAREAGESADAALTFTVVNGVITGVSVD